MVKMSKGGVVEGLRAPYNFPHMVTLLPTPSTCRWVKAFWALFLHALRVNIDQIMMSISVSAVIEENAPIEMNDLDWKEDGPDTPSTVNDSWPWEDKAPSPTSIQSSPLNKSGKSARLIAFAHEEFPLERPPIVCRMLHDTVPITTDHQVEKNEPIYNFSSRVIMSAMNYSSSKRQQSLQTIKSSGKSVGNDDQHENFPKVSFRNRLQQPHAIIPSPSTPSSSSISKSPPLICLHLQSATGSHSKSPPTSSKQLDHKYRSSLSASLAEDATEDNAHVKPAHILSSLISWLSPSGLHRTVKIAPNSSKSIMQSSVQTTGSTSKHIPCKVEEHRLSESTDHSPSDKPSNTTIPGSVLISTPQHVTTIVHINNSAIVNTAATMHAVRAWSSPPRLHTTTSNIDRPPSPLLTVPVRVIQRLPITNQ